MPDHPSLIDPRDRHGRRRERWTVALAYPPYVKCIFKKKKNLNADVKRGVRVRGLVVGLGRLRGLHPMFLLVSPGPS